MLSFDYGKCLVRLAQRLPLPGDHSRLCVSRGYPRERGGREIVVGKMLVWTSEDSCGRGGYCRRCGACRKAAECGRSCDSRTQGMRVGD